MEKDTVLSTVPFRMLMNVISHPIDYAKVLIQIGYEPLEPRPTTTLFGKPALKLPNIFQYVLYIKNVDGLSGCYRGLLPKLCAHTIYSVVSDKCYESIEFEDEADNSVPIDDLEDSERDKKYVQEYIKSLIGRIVGVVLSHPFEVISVRMMAQFVGGETKYVTLIGSIAEIYRENGISSFFVGIVPKLIATTTILTIVSTSTYVINKYFIQERELRTFASTSMTFLAATITYPFLVVSHCMAVNNCGLAAGEPPLMPIYIDWTDCWKHLFMNKQLNRGSSLIWRYYTGPTVMIHGRPTPDKSLLYSNKIK